ncbi:hypothetical protein [Roseibacillus ishigakijimensis]|uniref:Uncharacterized protein n=1 Tax=Roseibacillus ishigakijimensis TaxID=454146 RepID=A0A934RQX6_9BACT|nr:hypothetical protein [Roseibacillus ishigakijimensis]MBK1835315.1 hypothetical protein [Roseibacillus ishigakijimensis]
MNSTNILLGTTGLLLVVALVFSFNKMNQDEDESADKIAALARELERLEAEKNELEQRRSPGIIFQTSPVAAKATPELDESEEANQRFAAIQNQIEALTNENAALRDDLAQINEPAEEPELNLEALAEETEEPEVTAVNQSLIERRARLIRDAILQATVMGWDRDEWLAVIEGTEQANFRVGDVLALRRNDGILCTFDITRQEGNQSIAVLKGNLGVEPPEIVPGDELIIPPAFDGQLD